VVEDFETGDFSQYEWQFAGNANWTVVSSGAYEGTHCAKSGAIPDNGNTEMKLTIDVAANDSIAFYRKVSSEATYDFLRFYVDNSLKEEWSGEVAWSRVAYAVTAGEHTFRWVYIKDVYVVSGGDCAWVDFIELPGFADYTMAVNAGADAEICEGLTFQTNAFAANYVSLSWATSGSGTFSSTSTLATVYTPSANDYLEGFVILSLTAFGEGGQSLTDVLQLSFDRLPVAAGPITGLTTVCMGNSVSYSINEVEFAEWYLWTVTPAEAGTISGSSIEAVVSWTDGYTGAAYLKVQGMNECGEGVFSAELSIQVDDCTGIDESDRESVFTVSPNPSNGIFTLQFDQKTASAGQVVVKDALGKIVYRGSLTGSPAISMDLSHLENGLYYITVSGEQVIHSAKLIIKK
jgi:hypothetical protein